MKILVLSTGGTIGSVTHNGVISPNSKTTVKLLSLYSEQCSDSIEFIQKRVADTLSENVTDSFYEALINFLLSFDKSQFDGIIVLHGTDTLEYTASLVSMVCRDFSIPVGFVSADLPLENPQSNGVENFKAAISYIKAGGKGFFVPYRNRNDELKIHLSTRLLAADSVYDKFHSLCDKSIAHCKNNGIEFLNYPLLPSQSDLKKPKAPIFNDEIKFKKKILLIKTYPQIDYSIYDLQNSNIAAVLHLAYHSGTAPTYLSKFAIKCCSLGIDNYICPVKNKEDLYESAHEFFKCGVRPLPLMTASAALAKLKIFYNSELSKNEILTEDLYFETI